jgi:hypothetical protein
MVMATVSPARISFLKLTFFGMLKLKGGMALTQIR